MLGALEQQSRMLSEGFVFAINFLRVQVQTNPNSPVFLWPLMAGSSRS